MSKEHEAKGHPKEHDVSQQQQQQQPTGELTKPGSIHPFQAAPEPWPMDEDSPDAPPWEKSEFKRKVLTAGFPGSLATDTAFLATLYRWGGGSGAKFEAKAGK